jgi:Neuraminidase (sialidase)
MMAQATLSIQLMKSSDDGKTWSTPEVIMQSTETLDEPFLITDGQAIYLSIQSQKLGYQLKRL